jgi:hypothetical protein
MFTEEMVVTTHNGFKQMDHDTNKLPVLLCLRNVKCLCVSKLALSRSGMEMKFIHNQACFRLSRTSFYISGIQSDSVNFNKII